MGKCPNHSGSEIDFRCKSCERGFCLQCMDTMKGLLLCPDCRCRLAVYKMYQDHDRDLEGASY
ncbi:MAG: hypothetical protein HN837_09790 [Chloroflexi bacterium]|jgi:hypothetical protein|nr:hypothetical protein [Chloroflexota bacterium]MBT7290763.1 hypothetical protein [Chloroflexota bacterium]